MLDLQESRTGWATWVVTVVALAVVSSCSTDTRGLGPIPPGYLAGSGGATSGGASGTASGGNDLPGTGGGGGTASGGVVASGGRKGNGGGMGMGTAAGGASSSGGSGVGPAAKPECVTADDCRLNDDCCTCQAVPKHAPETACAEKCKQTLCERQQLSDKAMDCVAGRCVAGFNCDSAGVTCDQQTPACPAGQVPALNPSGSCYESGCVPVTQCKSVSSCAWCGPDQACVTMSGLGGSASHCVTIPTTCQGSASCGCFGPSTCLPPFSSCTQLSGVDGVACSCINC